MKTNVNAVKACVGLLCAATSFAVVSAWAEDITPPPAANAAPPAPTVPGMSGPLTANTKPMSYQGPLGTVFVGGVASGLAQWQDHPAVGDSNSQADVSNAQIYLNKTDGLVQFYGQFGSYSLPDLGVPYLNSQKTPQTFYGTFPQGFIKLAPNDSFSVEAGKLPTLIGAEYTFSFENMNIERGLLWNQENAVNRGVQVNYTKGPLALSVSWNDGLYSNKYSWAWLSATYTIDSSNTLAFIGSGNTKHTSVSTVATPLYQNNEQLYNLIYTHTAGPWTLQPYLQYTHVPAIPSIGALHEASTYGAALLASYKFNDHYSLPFRVEYIGSTGSLSDGAPNLMYGPGSKAWSLTLTPTYQQGIYFVRGELSYVGLKDTTPGLALGVSGNEKSQTRALVEMGVIF